MCGIIAVYLANAKANCAYQLYEGLVMLQHRGQDAAGMATCDNDRTVKVFKNTGLVNNVFDHSTMIDLKGRMGIGHNRYPTAGSHSADEAQPFCTSFPLPICLAHNGNLTNANEINDTILPGHLQVMTGSDSELLLVILADKLAQIMRDRNQKPRSTSNKRQRLSDIEINDLWAAMEKIFDVCRGGYACVVLINGVGILGFRDPLGIRPLVLGSRTGEHGTDHMIASESVCFDALGYELVRDVKPGEAVFIDTAGVLHSKSCCKKAVSLNPCIFEWVYFARPDSIIDGVSVHSSRVRMGELLGDKVARVLKGESIDVVVPVPETARTCANSLAQSMNLPCREGFVKNRYIARTFIVPGQKAREKSVRLKFNTVNCEFKDKNVLIVDDSIVRGTTSKKLVTLAKQAGAKKVFFCSASPPIRYPNVYGIDMPTSSELVAHNKNTEEIAIEIGADMVIFQDPEALSEAVTEINPSLNHFDMCCFDGNYVTQDIDKKYLESLHNSRNDTAQTTSNVKPPQLIRGEQLKIAKPDGEVVTALAMADFVDSDK